MSENDEENGNNEKIVVSIEEDAEKKQLVEKLKAEQKAKEEAEEQAEDYKSKLEILALRELEKHKNATKEKINTIFKDPARKAEMLAKIDEAKTPEQVKDLEYMTNMLEQELKPKEEKEDTYNPYSQHKTGGSTQITPQQLGQSQQPTDLRHRRFDDINQAIAEAQRQKREGTPEQQKDAEQVLKELWSLSMRSWRTTHEPISFSPDDQIPKKQGDAVVQEHELGNQLESEVTRITGIRKSPYGYSKTHRQDGSKKEGE